MVLTVQVGKWDAGRNQPGDGLPQSGSRHRKQRVCTLGVAQHRHPHSRGGDRHNLAMTVVGIDTLDKKPRCPGVTCRLKLPHLPRRERYTGISTSDQHAFQAVEYGDHTPPPSGLTFHAKGLCSIHDGDPTRHLPPRMPAAQTGCPGMVSDASARESVSSPGTRAPSAAPSVRTVEREPVHGCEKYPGPHSSARESCGPR